MSQFNEISVEVDFKSCRAWYLVEGDNLFLFTKAFQIPLGNHEDPETLARSILTEMLIEANP